MAGPVWIAALVALFVWWFATGAILLVVRRADRAGGGAHRRAVLAGVPVLLAGLAGVSASVGDASVAGAYLGFLSALAVWGWIELTFLTGSVTGAPGAPGGAGGGARLLGAWNAVAHHELLLLGGLLLMLAAAHGQANGIALETYLVLFAARVSAKLNLFFGVPRINLEFVPAPLSHLKPYFRQGPVTPLFPVAIAGLTLLVASLGHAVVTAPTPAGAVGAALLATLAALALVEHALMVVPLPDAKLWRWMLPAPSTHGRDYPPTPMTPSER